MSKMDDMAMYCTHSRSANLWRYRSSDITDVAHEIAYRRPTSMVMALLREEQFLSNYVGCESDDRYAETRKHLAEHGTLLKYRVSPPRVRFRPWVAV